MFFSSRAESLFFFNETMRSEGGGSVRKCFKDFVEVGYG